MEEQNNISSSEDSSSSEEEEDFDDFWKSHFEIKTPEAASEAEIEAEIETEVEGSPIDTEVYSGKPEPAVMTSFPERDFRLFKKYF